MARTDMLYYIFSENKQKYFCVDTFSFVEDYEDASGFSTRWLRDMVLSIIKKKLDSSCRASNKMSIRGFDLDMREKVDLRSTILPRWLVDFLIKVSEKPWTNIFKKGKRDE